MVMIMDPNQQNQPFGFNNTGVGNQYLNELHRQQQAAAVPADPYAGLRAQLAAQRARFDPNYMRNYQPAPPVPVPGLLDDPAVSAFNTAHGYTQQPGPQIIGQLAGQPGGQGGTNPLVAAYIAAKGYK